jgi:hypothetical protein
LGRGRKAEVEESTCVICVAMDKNEHEHKKEGDKPRKKLKPRLRKGREAKKGVEKILLVRPFVMSW